VPFCLFGGTALVTGIGEKITPLPPLPDCFILLAKNEKKRSTAAMYAELDQRGLKTFMPLWEGTQVPTLCRCMTNHGVRHTSLTGSGPTVFGIFDREDQAKQCMDELVETGIEWVWMGKGVKCEK